MSPSPLSRSRAALLAVCLLAAGCGGASATSAPSAASSSTPAPTASSAATAPAAPPDIRITSSPASAGPRTSASPGAGSFRELYDGTTVGSDPAWCGPFTRWALVEGHGSSKDSDEVVLANTRTGLERARRLLETPGLPDDIEQVARDTVRLDERILEVGPRGLTPEDKGSGAAGLQLLFTLADRLKSDCPATAAAAGVE